MPCFYQPNGEHFKQVVPEQLPLACGGADDPQRKLRAWQGIVVAMLTDFSFLYD